MSEAVECSRIKLRFPGDIDYIPPVRKFVAEILTSARCSPKFAYRSEIIVDEICHNAITYGCQTPDAEVELVLDIHADRIELEIKDPGIGREEDRRRLMVAVDDGRAGVAPGRGEAKKERLGLEIVKMLSEKLDFAIDENNLTSVRVVRRREDVSVSG